MGKTRDKEVRSYVDNGPLRARANEKPNAHVSQLNLTGKGFQRKMTRAGYPYLGSVKDDCLSKLRRPSKFHSALDMRGHIKTGTLNLEAEVALQIQDALYLHTHDA